MYVEQPSGFKVPSLKGWFTGCEKLFMVYSKGFRTSEGLLPIPTIHI